MVKNYKRGKDFELEIKKKLTDSGWIVRRAFASKGIFDLLAYKDGLKWGIQAKSLGSNNNRKYLTPVENKTLCEYSISPSDKYEFVTWKINYRMPVMELLNEQFIVIHAYNMFPGIGWRVCKKGKWIDIESPLYVK